MHYQGKKPHDQVTSFKAIVFINGRCMKMLYDSIETHSFVSNLCVDELGLLVKELSFELMLSTLASGKVLTTTVCTRCPVVVEGHRFKINMICLPLQELDVILGMNSLFEEHVIIDCGH